MATEYINNKNFEMIIRAFQFQKRYKARVEMMVADLQETNVRRIAKYADDLKNLALSQTHDEYLKVCADFNTYQDQLAKLFYLLSDNITNYAKFSGVDVDDAIQEGVLICFQKIDLFDPRKGKAFNYMTTCILNHLRQQYRSARNYNELKKRYQIHLQDKFDNVVVRNGKERTQHKSTLEKDTTVW